MDTIFISCLNILKTRIKKIHYFIIKSSIQKFHCLNYQNKSLNYLWI